MVDQVALQRVKELTTLTLAASAKRGDTIRMVCLDCDRKRDFTASALLAREGDKIVGALKPLCTRCQRTGRKGVGLHKPGYGTYVQIIAPGDPK